MSNPTQNPKSNETPQQIKMAAFRLFASQGYDGTTIRDIVETAGVTKPVLYYYFKNKEELYLSIIQEAYQYFFSQLVPILERKEAFRDKLMKVVALYLLLTEEKTDVIRMLFDVLIFPKRNKISSDFVWDYENRHIALIESLFAEGMQTNQIREGPLEPVVNHFLGSIFIYILIKLTENREIPEGIQATIVDYVLHGLGESKQ
ncbi:MAG: TetR/AcrR family transcriptional regulator [bacterium]|jgi:AcrR family transcriptional regulator|nr:TetR/AcrR family transcriptional regulator [bacterium]